LHFGNDHLLFAIVGGIHETMLPSLESLISADAPVCVLQEE